jgi:hypothetical protein
MAAKKNRLARRAKPTDIISHSARLIDKLQISSDEFYRRVETELTDRKVPGLELCRVDWKEGGVLSPRREYLRISRERLIFDVCAAPFGTGFFVSTWFGERPLYLGLILRWVCILLLMAAVDLFVPGGLAANLKHAYGAAAVYLPLAAVFWLGVISFAVAYGMQMDAALIRTPIVGYFYERYFRAITLYRIDLACMYQQAVESVVNAVIDETCQAQGIESRSEWDRPPVFKRLLDRRAEHVHI